MGFSIRSRARERKGSVLMAAACAALIAVGVDDAPAFNIPVENENFDIKFDTTLRYTYGIRMEGRNGKLANYAVNDDSNWLFGLHDTVANRLDILTEFDVLYKKVLGVRFSAQGWYDDAYDDYTGVNPRRGAAASSYDNARFSNFTDRFYAGPSGEILDALVFTKFDLAGMPVSVKGGRHTVYWGEALLLGGGLHGNSYGQMPIDFQKGFASPGAEVKELFRPLNNISFQIQVTNTVTLQGQYFLEWEPYRFPEGGTYLGPADFLFHGPDKFNAFRQGAVLDPEHRGDVGVGIRWSPEWLQGTVGFYYRNFSDKIPQILRTRADPTRYHMVYADDIDMFGLSLTRPVFGLALGVDFNYRKNMPLNSQTFALTDFPNQGETGGARGDTWHLVTNVIGILPEVRLFGFKIFDTATYNAEGVFARWERVRSGEQFFNAEGFAPCIGKNKYDGCVTKNFFSLGGNFIPTWFQVLPGADLTLPLSYSRGVVGNAPNAFGGNQGTGNYAVGVGVNLYQRYLFDIKYVDFFGPTKENATSVVSQNGLTALLKDRGALYFTFKTTF